MRKILLLLIICFLSKPIYAKNTSDWFKANALCVSIDNVNDKWQKCNIPVCLGDDRKVTIYAQETQTIRAMSKVEDYADESGVSGMFWQAVDQKGTKCIVNIQSDEKSYIHLILTFYEDNYAICYNLIPDD